MAEKNKNEKHLLTKSKDLLKKRKSVVILILLFLIIMSPKVIPVLANAFSGPEKRAVLPLETDVMVVTPQVFEHSIAATGNLQAVSRVNLSAEVAGKITGYFIKDGTQVEEGDLLLKINDNDLQAELKGAQFELNLLQQVEERNKQLLEKGGINQEEYDAIRGELNSKRAEVELIEAKIQRTEIRAPFDGFLGLSYVDKGAYITPNVKLASLQDLSEIEIEFSVSERYSSQIAPGNEIRFQVQGIDSVFSGEVYAVEPQIDVQSRTFNVRARSSNPDLLLRPGSYADVTLVLSSREDALLVPNIALVPEGEDFKVYTYQDGKAIAKNVKIGKRDRESTRILQGLTSSDTILVNGLQKVKDSSKVAIRNIQTYE